MRIMSLLDKTINLDVSRVRLNSTSKKRPQQTYLIVENKCASGHGKLTKSGKWMIQNCNYYVDEINALTHSLPEGKGSWHPVLCWSGHYIWYYSSNVFFDRNGLESSPNRAHPTVDEGPMNHPHSETVRVFPRTRNHDHIQHFLRSITLEIWHSFPRWCFTLI